MKKYFFYEIEKKSLGKQQEISNKILFYFKMSLGIEEENGFKKIHLAHKTRNLCCKNFVFIYVCKGIKN